MAKRRDLFLEGKAFEYYAWPTVRRNFPRRDGWKRFEQPRLPSGLQPDNVLWNENTGEAVVIEMKDVAVLTEAHVRKVIYYMREVETLDEVEAVKGFMPIAWDTEVLRGIRQLAKRHGITVRRLEWRRT